MYSAQIVRITKLEKIPGADKIALAVFPGYQVVVGKDTQVGDLGIFFPTDGQLTDAFLSANDLYRIRADGSKGGGYFERNGRVTAIKLMKGTVASYGFWLPISCLSHFGDVSTLKEGDSLTSFSGIEICRKYETPATVASKSRIGRAMSRTQLLPKYGDTEQLARNLDVVAGYGNYVRVIITEKIHGTSARTGKVVKFTEDNRWHVRLLRALGIIRGVPTNRESLILNGTRNTIVEDRNFQPGDADYYRVDILSKVYPWLHEGECIFYEVAGYDSNNGPIMNPYKDVPYAYGTSKYGRHRKVFVYAIKEQRIDGSWCNMPWNHVVKRAKELGLDTVPVIVDTQYDDFFLEPLEEYVMSIADNCANRQPSRVDSTHVSEGVVVRLESEFGISVFKHKSFAFLEQEGIIKATDVVDTEEAN